MFAQKPSPKEGTVGAQRQWQQRFSYDTLGRLTSAGEYRGDNLNQTYLLNYDYDSYGNRYQKQSRNQNNPFAQVWVESGSFGATTNRLTSGVTYDEAGNVTADSRFRNLAFQYDANNRQRQSSNLDGRAPVQSVYDGAGRRVAVKSGGQITNVMVYDAAGDLVAEYGGAVSTNGTSYVMGDHQGSTRAVMTSGGAVVSRHDYMPFGEEVAAGVGMRTVAQGYSQPDSVREKYAGMEADDATGMSHTLWREYDSLSARWTAPDPYGGSMDSVSPQSFNRYTYVNNDPVNHVDPTGLRPSDIGVVQTDDAGFAESLELRSLGLFLYSTNEAFRDRWDEKIKRQQSGGKNGAGTSSQGGQRTISFVRLGEVNLLGKIVPVYVATGQTQEYRDKVLKNAQDAAGLINCNADILSPEEKVAISNINIIAAIGVGVGWNEVFKVEGLPHNKYAGAEGIDPEMGIFYTAQIINTSPENWAPQLAHEGQHMQDYITKSGAYSDEARSLTPEQAWDMNERRAISRQLGVYRKIQGISKGSHKLDPMEKMLEHLLIQPHRRMD